MSRYEHFLTTESDLGCYPLMAAFAKFDVRFTLFCNPEDGKTAKELVSIMPVNVTLDPSLEWDEWYLTDGSRAFGSTGAG